MSGHDGQGVGIAELKARPSAHLRRERGGETVTVYDRDTL
jgi:antitoxin (DNA-binding transcriptional repressor) of toxin-antitoxin stability system